MLRMRKDKAIELLGGTTATAAEAIGISYQAVDKWPDELPRRIEDRVLAALYRRTHGATNPALAKPAQAEA